MDGSIDGSTIPSPYPTLLVYNGTIFLLPPRYIIMITIIIFIVTTTTTTTTRAITKLFVVHETYG